MCTYFDAENLFYDVSVSKNVQKTYKRIKSM